MSERPGCLGEPIFVSTNLNLVSDAFLNATAKLSEVQPSWVQGSQKTDTNIVFYDLPSQKIMSRVFIEEVTRQGNSFVPRKSVINPELAKEDPAYPSRDSMVISSIGKDAAKALQARDGQEWKENEEYHTEAMVVAQSQSAEAREKQPLKVKNTVLGAPKIVKPVQQKQKGQNDKKKSDGARKRPRPSNDALSEQTAKNGHSSGTSTSKPPQKKNRSGKTVPEKGDGLKKGEVKQKSRMPKQDEAKNGSSTQEWVSDLA